MTYNGKFLEGTLGLVRAAEDFSRRVEALHAISAEMDRTKRQIGKFTHRCPATVNNSLDPCGGCECGKPTTGEFCEEHEL